MDKDLTWPEFMRVEMRIGTIIEATVFKEARNPSYKLKVDFGAFGIKKSSAQVTQLYTPETLIGKQVIGVINFPDKQIATLMSECLILGAVDGQEITLLQPERKVENGLRIG